MDKIVPNRIRRKANRSLYKNGKTCYAKTGYVKLMRRFASGGQNTYRTNKK